MNENKKYFFERLVDTFNRYGWRAVYFISSFMNINEFPKHDYTFWSKEFFNKFYSNSKSLKGYSEKVIACFLQQGSRKSDIIPVDTWIQTFFNFLLGINEKEIFLNSFEKSGKLERTIWVSI